SFGCVALGENGRLPPSSPRNAGYGIRGANRLPSESTTSLIRDDPQPSETSMRQLFVRVLPPVLALAALLGPARSCQTQAIWSREAERALAPGAYVPYDGASPYTRYNFYDGPALYFNGDARRLYMLDYIDRVDRAHRLGYPEPPPPALWPASRRCPSR